MRLQTMATPESLTRLIKTCVVGRVGGELLPNHFDPESTYSNEENIQYGRYLSELRRNIGICLTYHKIDIDKKEGFEVKPESDLFYLVFELAKHANALALKNKGLISLVLKNFDNGYYTEQDLEDLYQQGWEKGLFKAALIYDPDYNKLPSMPPYKFPSIAVPYIKGAMLRYMANLETVWVPHYMLSGLNNFGKIKQMLTQWFHRDAVEQEVLAFIVLETKLLRNPSEEELQEYLDKLRQGGNEKVISSFRRFKIRMNQGRNAHGISSLSDARRINFRDTTGEWTIGDFGERGDDFTDVLIDHESQSPEDTVCGKMLREEIARSLALLTDREKEILVLRFGLNGESDHTLEEVGQFFHLTTERVRQIEDKALRKLRRPTKQTRELRDYMT